MRDMKLLSQFRYSLRPAVTVHESSFKAWHEKNIDMLDIPTYMNPEADSIFSPEFVACIKMNMETDSNYAELIKRYVRSEKLSVKDVPLDLSDELIYLNNQMEVFFLTPIILYIIKDLVKNETK
jgi:hypothetical protein